MNRFPHHSMFLGTVCLDEDNSQELSSPHIGSDMRVEGRRRASMGVDERNFIVYFPYLVGI